MRFHSKGQADISKEASGASSFFKVFPSFLNLRFSDPNLERAYQDDHFQKSILPVRVSLLLAIGLYAVFGILDSQIVPDVMYDAWIIRYVIFCPLTLLVFFMSYMRGFQGYLKASLMIMGFVGGAGIVVMIGLANPPGSDLYYAGLILTSIFYFIFLRLDLVSASILAWSIFFLYLFTAVWVKGVSTYILINNTFFFMAFNLAGMVACYRIERYMRSDFLQRRTIIDQAEKLNMIFDHTPVGIMHFDSDGVITACNPSFEKVLGSSRDRIVGLKMLSDLKDVRVIESVRECLKGVATSHEGKYVSVTANKEAVGKAVFSPTFDSEGRVTGGIGIIEDITDRYNAEQALRQSELSYKSLYSMMRLMCDNVPDLMWAKDLDGKFTFVNRAMIERLLGARDTDEPIGKNDMYFAERHRLERPDDPEWFTFGEICVNSDEVIISIRRPEKFDEFGNVYGQFLFLDVYKAPFIDENGIMIGTVGCGRDVTRERRLEKERQRAIDALIESEKKFRFITESVADNVWMMDLDLRTTYVSPSIEKLLGFTTEERKRQSIEEMLTPASLERTKAIFSEEMRKEMEGGHDPDRNIIVEVEYFKKDGSVTWAENNIRAIRNSEGLITGLLGLSRDITERKRDQQRLEKLNHCLLSLGSDYRTNVSKLTALCGELLEATCALYTGLNKGILFATGQWNTPPDFVPEDNPEGHICYDVVRQNQKLLLIRNLQDTIYAVTDPNVMKFGLQTYMGSVVHRSQKPYGSLCVVFQRDFIPTEDEKHIIQIVASAISSEEDREMSASQLRQRQAMEHLLLEISGAFISVAAADIDRAIDESLMGIGGFCGVDRSYVFLFDYSSRSMSNTHEWCAEGVSHEKLSVQGLPMEKLKALMASLTAGQDVHVPDVSKLGDEWDAERNTFEAQSIKSLVIVPMFQYESLMGFVGFDSVRANRVWEEWQVTLLHMYADRLSAAMERKKAEEERSRLNAQLVWSQKMEAIGTLAGGVAHDFNNLLQVILGFAEALSRTRKETDKDYVKLQHILEAGRKGAELVRRLLTFSRKVEPALSVTDLNQEIIQFQAFLSRTIPKTIKIELRLNGDLKKTLADSSQVHQVLMNLGVNARDAMTDGGTLTIQTDNVELTHDYCTRHVGAKSGQYILLAISDTGHGMDKETLDHIFEPFFTTKKHGKGTGLGLATVYGIVKQHLGYITCYSERSLGTTFKIYFPATDQGEKTGAQEPDVAINGGRETILLVDDESNIREWCKELLESYDYTVLTAGNGREALDVYLKYRDIISLVLLDLVMPEMDGRRCLHELRKIEPKVKAIVTSGYSGTEQINMMLSLGAADFVGKPYDGSELLMRIRHVLDRRL